MSRAKNGFAALVVASYVVMLASTDAAKAQRLTQSSIVRPPLSCTPGPCTFPNVQASNGSGAVVGPRLAVNPAKPSQLMGAAKDDNCVQFNGREAGVYASSDGGTTWKQYCLSFGGDPVTRVAYDQNGVAYAVGITGFGKIAITHSTTQGASWSNPVDASVGMGMLDLAIDVNAASPRKGTIYLSGTQYEDGSGATHDSQILVAHSNDGGATWATVAVNALQVFPKVSAYSDMAIGADGTVYLSYIKCTVVGLGCGGTTATMMLSKSANGGSTWSAPKAIGKAKLSAVAQGCEADFPVGDETCFGSLPNTNVGVADSPSLAIDTSAGLPGTLYMVDTTWTGSYMKVQIASSTDGGAFWSKPKRVTPSSDTKDQFFPRVSISGAGLVGVSWLDRRNDPSNLNYDAFGAISKDGVHYPNLKLSTVSSNPLHDGSGGRVLIGTGNAWAKNNLYSVWPDTRSGVSAAAEIGGMKR